MSWFSGAEKAPELVREAAELRRGEKVLAFAQDGDRWLLGTRLAFVVVDPGQPTVRLAWEQIQAADWSQDDSTLKVSEVGRFGQSRASYVFTLDSPALLLQLVRERVTASVVLQRGYLVTEKAGFKVIGRRAPDGGPISWMHEYDAGIDPEDPEVVAAAADALLRARADVGE
ncbi:hypothetical protein EFK50_07975 [Nocardioides marmoriginsengisoli]|uniref:Uncharacterized protein n=1 Tax=Nocardioides marmoriginsengisoli TaxID=661483 RepID=A0A3N0CK68_9ACTN|nr:hypothetical protein [Nocardioides marmoriginsengisoli]RNL63671.1 hypothetical protein EFK50_07975 [Nocardioides marmoriginsengisoli]